MKMMEIGAGVEAGCARKEGDFVVSINTISFVRFPAPTTCTKSCKSVSCITLRSPNLEVLPKIGPKFK